MADKIEGKSNSPLELTKPNSSEDVASLNHTQRTLREVGYNEGKNMLSPNQDLAMPDMSQLSDEEKEKLQKSFRWAQVGATVKNGRELLNEDGMKVKMLDGTKISASVSNRGVRFVFRPGVSVEKDWSPDFSFEEVYYSFDDAKFKVEGDASSWGWQKFDMFDIIKGIGEGKAVDALEKELRPKLPKKMKKPGYNISNDKDLIGTIQELQKAFGIEMEGDVQSAADKNKQNPSKDGTNKEFDNLKDFHGEISINAPWGFKAPLGTDDLMVNLDEGTSLMLQLSTSGDVKSLKIDSLTLRAGKPGVVIKPSKGWAKDISEMDIFSISVGQGGEFNFDYELVPESMIDGIKALGILLALHSGHPVNTNISRTRLTAIRKEIDQRLKKEVEPKFKEYILKMDPIIPGPSLKQVFGL